MTCCSGFDGGVVVAAQDADPSSPPSSQYNRSSYPSNHPPTPLPHTFDMTPEVLRLLLELASINPSTRRLLRGLGGLSRLAALVASFNGGDNKYLLLNQPSQTDEILTLAIRLLALLVEEAHPTELHTPATLSAFASRRFIEMAATYHPEPSSCMFASFLTHCPEPAASAALIRALIDRALEAAALSTHPSIPNQAPAYRYAALVGAKPLLRVLQAVLSVDKDSPTHQTFRLEQSLPLADRCTRLLTRRGVGGSPSGGELDLVWMVAKLFFVLAARSPVAAAFVSSRLSSVVKEWKGLIAAGGGGGGRR